MDTEVDQSIGVPDGERDERHDQDATGRFFDRKIQIEPDSFALSGSGVVHVEFIRVRSGRKWKHSRLREQTLLVGIAVRQTGIVIVDDEWKRAARRQETRIQCRVEKTRHFGRDWLEGRIVEENKFVVRVRTKDTRRGRLRFSLSQSYRVGCPGGERETGHQISQQLREVK